jgi:hypothetical protein
MSEAINSPQLDQLGRIQEKISHSLPPMIPVDQVIDGSDYKDKGSGQCEHDPVTGGWFHDRHSCG